MNNLKRYKQEVWITEDRQDVYLSDDVDDERQAYKDEIARYVIDMGKLEKRIQNLEEEKKEVNNRMCDCLDMETCIQNLEEEITSKILLNELLIKDNDRLRKALEEIDTECHCYKPLSTIPEIETIHDIVTEALKEGENAMA